MYYVISYGKIRQVKKREWEKSPDGIGVFGIEEWNRELEQQDAFSQDLREDNIHYCKLESHKNYLFGTLQIPVKRRQGKSLAFSFYILDGKVIFIDDSSIVEETIEKIANRKLRDSYRLEQFFYDFLMCMVDEDIVYLAEIERDIEEIEENILKGKTERFSYRMLENKKEISRLYCYYSQLSDIGEILCENAREFFGKEDIATYQIFTARAARLREEAQVLREYAMQVQDVYQSEIGIRQNDIMKVLTIVTTIFLPLTLIAGWYGMNFYNMPELSSRYGYPLTALGSLFIVVFSLWYFKKKKFW